MTGSSGPAAYANVDVELFGLDQVTHTNDQRSVGELLFDVDRQARTLLVDVTEDDVAQLLQAWPGLVSAAVNLWQNLPCDAATTRRETATPIDRVAQISDAISHRLTTNSWPPSTAADPRLSEMTRNLDHASSLVKRFADRAPLSNAGRDDLNAARARIMHSLYIAAHAVTVSLIQYGRTRRDQAAATRRPLATPTGLVPYAVAPTTEWVRRMAAVEAAAATFASPGRLPALLDGEQRAPLADADRLTRALATWDVQAHRGLVAHVWRDNMVLITRTQALITGTAMVLVNAAAADGQLDPSPRLVPALGRAGAAWSDLGSRWDDLAPLNAHPSTQLLLAAGEIRAATRELTHDGATMASQATIVSRPGHHQGLASVLHALGHADELAHAVAERATTPGLVGRARAMSIRAHNDVGAVGDATPREGDVVWVSPEAILAKRVVEAPLPVIAGLQTASQAVVDAATTAGGVASLVVGVRPSAQHSLASRKGAEWHERQPGILTSTSARSVPSRGRR